MNIPIGGEDTEGGTVAVKILLGQEELKEKLSSVIAILHKADLVDEIVMFHDRVIVPALKDFNKVIDHEEIRENVFICRFKPMVELLLEEMRSAAEDSGLIDSMRKKRIAEAMDMAGF
jgi:hypothetical protein